MTPDPKPLRPLQTYPRPQVVELKANPDVASETQILAVKPAAGSAGPAVFSLVSDGVVIATCTGIGAGRVLGQWALGHGSDVVVHNYDLTLDDPYMYAKGRGL